MVLYLLHYLHFTTTSNTCQQTTELVDRHIDTDKIQKSLWFFKVPASLSDYLIFVFRIPSLFGGDQQVKYLYQFVWIVPINVIDLSPIQSHQQPFPNNLFLRVVRLQWSFNYSISLFLNLEW